MRPSKISLLPTPPSYPLAPFPLLFLLCHSSQSVDRLATVYTASCVGRSNGSTKHKHRTPLCTSGAIDSKINSQPSLILRLLQPFSSRLPLSCLVASPCEETHFVLFIVLDTGGEEVRCSIFATIGCRAANRKEGRGIYRKCGEQSKPTNRWSVRSLAGMHGDGCIGIVVKLRRRVELVRTIDTQVFSQRLVRLVISLFSYSLFGVACLLCS
ncbi:hypothetical protein HDK77DRAFT_174574 [Phyllosticta capitalensis]